MRKKQPRKPAAPDERVGATPQQADATPTGRRARVRNRLLVSVVVCAITVLAAGTPGVLAASEDVSDSQRLVGLARLDEDTVRLSHALGDERDSAVEYVARGHSTHHAMGYTPGQRARVDRQAGEVRADSAVPDSLTHRLDGLAAVRARALKGHASAHETYTAYTAVIRELHRVSDRVARDLPGRAQTATADALPRLGLAADQASAARGLLLAALSGTGEQRTLTGAAQQAHAREKAALADFQDIAGGDARDAYDGAVAGTDTTHAEHYLARLTDAPYLDLRDRALGRDRVASAITARLDRMRGVEASFATKELHRLEKQRDDDVTALEVHVAVLGALLLIAVGVSVQTARSMARPLSVLTRGSRRLAEDPAGEEPVSYRGRNDEFAEVVRSLNRLHGIAATLRARAADPDEGAPASASGTGDGAAGGAEGDAAASATATEESDDRAELAAELARLRDEYEALRERLAGVHGAASADESAEEDAEEDADAAPAGNPYVDRLTLRTLGLLENQLALIEQLEKNETDPDQLDTLFRLDHLATRMRRHGENLLLLAGSEPVGRRRARPVLLVDALRAAVSETERYERVEIGELPPLAHVRGAVSDDLGRLVAELLDNAEAASPAESRVRIAGWALPEGGVLLSVQDSGVGASAERLAALNARLRAEQADVGTEGEAEAEAEAPSEAAADAGGEQLGIGLQVVARLAARYGIRVELHAREDGAGLAAVVTLPDALLDAEAAATAAGPGAGFDPFDAFADDELAAAFAQLTQSGPVAGDDDGDGGDGGENDADGGEEPGRTAGTWSAVAADAPFRGGFGAGDELGDLVEGDAEVPVARPSADPDDPAHLADPATEAGAGGDPADDRDTDDRDGDEGPPTGSLRGLAVSAENDPLIAAAERAMWQAGRPADSAGSASAAEPGAPGGRTPGPEEHARADQLPVAPVEPDGMAAESVRSEAPGGEAPRRFTAKGLPKRTPRRVTAQPGLSRQRQPGLSPEELRNRLGGFQQGAQQGRREAEAEAEAQAEAPSAEAAAESGAGEPERGEARPAAEPAPAREAGRRSGVQSDGGTAEEART